MMHVGLQEETHSYVETQLSICPKEIQNDPL